MFLLKHLQNKLGLWKSYDDLSVWSLRQEVPYCCPCTCHVVHVPSVNSKSHGSQTKTGFKVSLCILPRALVCFWTIFSLFPNNNVCLMAAWQALLKLMMKFSWPVNYPAFTLRAPQSWTWKHKMCLSSVLNNICISTSMIEVSNFHTFYSLSDVILDWIRIWCFAMQT